MVRLSILFRFSFLWLCRPYYPVHALTWTVWAGPRSLATTYGITIVFFSSGYLDVSVPRVPLPYGIPYLQYGGLPHSDIHGSMLMCSSPWLFAAYHVLLRPWKPRHPLYALVCFSSYSCSILTFTCLRYVKELNGTPL